jgi:hypothetical protein
MVTKVKNKCNKNQVTNCCHFFLRLLIFFTYSEHPIPRLSNTLVMGCHPVTGCPPYPQALIKNALTEKVSPTE